MKLQRSNTLAAVAAVFLAAIANPYNASAETTPLQLGLFPPYQLYPGSYDVSGLRLNIFYVDNRTVPGIDVGGYNKAGEFNGLQFAAYECDTSAADGIQLAGGFCSVESSPVRGVQIAGLGVAAASLNGLQFTLGEALSDPVYGGQFAVYRSQCTELNGWQSGGLRADADAVKGIQTAVFYADAERTIDGAQLTLFAGEGEELQGVQMGAFVAKVRTGKMSGLQASLGACFAREKLVGGFRRLPRRGVAAPTSPLERDVARGVQFAGIVCEAENSRGVQVAGGWNRVTGRMEGMQVSVFYNRAALMNGVQFGLYNACDQLQGFQIGLINRSHDSDLPFLPLVNARF